MPISPPTSLTASHNYDTGYNVIQWSAVEDATSYRVYYSLLPNVTTSDAYVTSISNTASVNIVANNVNAYYRVLSLDSVGDVTSSFSSELTFSYSLIPTYYFYYNDKNNPKGWSRNQGIYGAHPANVDSRFVNKSIYWLGLYSGVVSTGGGNESGANGQDVPGSDGSPSVVKLKSTGIVKTKFKISGRNIDLRRKKIPNGINYDDRYKDTFGNATYLHVTGS